MEFRILGPLEVVDDGEVVDVGAGKQRALLAALLLAPNRSVSKDELIDALWGERPTETASKGLHVYVSHLRKALGRDRIVTHAHGYELRAEADELDVQRFESLVAARRLDEALALWRGQPLADFAYEPFAQGEIARLSEVRLACLEDRIEAELDSGRHAAVVGELEGLVLAHPLRERLRAQLMLALYRSGRQAEALDAYAAARTILADELGLEPGAELRELQHAILAQDPALSPPERPASAGRPESVDDAPVATEPVVREVRKTVTVLSCDLVAVGAPLDPESLRRVTDLGFGALRPPLQRRAATVERSLGGAVTAIFGMPAVHEDDALRAVTAADEMRDALAGLRDELEEQWAAWLELRAGIATGEVVAGQDGGQAYAAGAPVVSALRLQQEAQAGCVLLDERTHRLVKDAVDAEADGGGFRLVDVRPVRERRSDSPMVGRQRERRRLDDAFEQAKGDRSCQLFTILGAPGVGKSRLVREFVSALPEDTVVAQGRCLPYGEGITYWPVLEAIRDAAGLDDATSDAENLRRLVDVLDGDEEAEATARRLGEVVGLVEQTSGAEETFRAVRTFVESVARRQPLVLVFDDIHWGESTFLDLVDHVADWTHDAPILLLCMARPELYEVRPQWGGGKLNATAVHLEPLSESESAELVDNLAGAGALDDAARRHVVDAASGNPLFVEELLALVLDQGGDVGALELPPTIQALLAARLDRLPDDERTLLEAASVEGKVFHEATAGQLASLAPSDARRHLESLVRKELVRSDRPLFSGERAFTFRHLLIRDAAYEAVPKEVRARLHERYADWLERRVGERTLEFGEIIGYHLEQAFRYRSELGRIDAASPELGRRAAELLGAAGRRAFLRSDAPAGANLISRAVALLSPDDPLRVELVPNVRVAQGLDLAWAERVLTEAVEAAATTGDRRLAAHALVQRGLLRLFTDEDVTPAELLDLSARAVGVFESLGDELGLARAWRLASQAHYLGRRTGLCVEVSGRALAHAWRAGDRFEEREIVEWLVIALMLGATPAVEAASHCEQLLEQVSDNPELHAQLHAALAALAAMQGRFDEAHASLERSKEMMAGLSEWIWIVAIWWGFVFVWQDDIERAEEELRPAYEALRSIGEKSHFSSITHYMTVVAYARGDLVEAERLTYECEHVCRPNDVHSRILYRSIRAKVFARTGRVDEGKMLAREAIALAETGDFLLARSDAVADLGEVLELAGERDAAVAALEEAAALYAEKGITVEVAKVRARMARLSAG